jgi:hypothetical protein
LLALSAPRRSRPDIRRCFGAAAGGDYERSVPNSVSLRLGNFKLAAGPGIERAALVVLVELTFSGEHRITVCPVRVEDGLFKLLLRCYRGSLDISGASIRDNEHALVEGVSCCGHQAVPLSFTPGKTVPRAKKLSSDRQASPSPSSILARIRAMRERGLDEV